MTLTKSLIAILVSVVAPLAVAQAAGSAVGMVSEIQSYPGHTGLLIRLNTAFQNPDGCQGSIWYIFPDDSPRAQFVQSMLLTAYEGRDTIQLGLDGCYQSYPKVTVVSINGK